VSKHHKTATNPCAEVQFADAPHPSVDLTDRHPTDAALRAHGFSIWARPAGRPPVWVRGGKQYTQAAAVSMVLMEQKHQQSST
jgi:hypothetical protein